MGKTYITNQEKGQNKSNFNLKNMQLNHKKIMNVKTNQDKSQYISDFKLENQRTLLTFWKLFVIFLLFYYTLWIQIENW